MYGRNRFCTLHGLALYVRYSLSCSSDFCTPYVSKTSKKSNNFQKIQIFPKSQNFSKKAKISQRSQKKPKKLKFPKKSRNMPKKSKLSKKIQFFPKTASSAASVAFATSTAYLASLVCLIVLKNWLHKGNREYMTTIVGPR
jgi:hypothetical protein